MRRFDRDSANKILWFSTPPVVYPTTTRPRPSVKYLTFRAKQVTTGALETDEGEERPLDPELKGALESLVDGRLGAMTAFGKEFDDRSGSALFEDVQRLCESIPSPLLARLASLLILSLAGLYLTVAESAFDG